MRTRSHILGRPGLTARHHDAVVHGNSTMRLSARILASCIRLGVPCFLENPHSSMLFKAPAIAKLIGDTRCQTFISDHCQYGARWRKTTRVCTWLSTSEAPSRRCCSLRGQPCSRSQQKHIDLSGRSAQGGSWTKIARAYPRSWARAWAACMIASAENATLRRLASLSSYI